MRPASQAASMPPLDQADLCCLPTDGPAHKAPRQAGGKGVIRIGVAREVSPLLREFGANPSEVIGQAGLARRDIRQDECEGRACRGGRQPVLSAASRPFPVRSGEWP
jgi:hypothetical protein